MKVETRLARLEERAGVNLPPIKQYLILSQVAAGSNYYKREDDKSRVHVDQFAALEERYKLIIAIRPAEGGP